MVIAQCCNIAKYMAIVTRSGIEGGKGVDVIFGRKLVGDTPAEMDIVDVVAALAFPIVECNPGAPSAPFYERAIRAERPVAVLILSRRCRGRTIEGRPIWDRPRP